MWFQKISIPPPPTDGSSDYTPPPTHLEISIPEGSCITPYPPGISYFLFHGLNLPYLEIIDCVPLKIDCSHLKTQFFIIFDLFVIFYRATCISYAGRTCLIDYEQSLFFISPFSQTHEAWKQRFISLCHLKKTWEHNFKFELFIEIKLCEHFWISKWIYLQIPCEYRLNFRGKCILLPSP